MTKQPIDKVWDAIVHAEKKENAAKFVEEDKVLAPLLPEIARISDMAIQYFVRAVLLKCDPVFWQCPSSFSGKYHPPDEHGTGGNVLHTKRVVRVAELICDSYEVEDEERDIILAACIIHDITKGVKWDPNQPAKYDPMHPYTVDKFVRSVREENKLYGTDDESTILFVREEVMFQILRLVRCHMGPWSPIPETIPITASDMIMHLSDHIASKLHLIIDGDDILMERWLTKVVK